MRLIVKETVGELTGELAIPNSKYHAHRALILASLADGTSYIHGLSDAGHVRYTIGALRALGTRIDVDGNTFVVRGGPYRPRRADVSVGSSGTTLYFLTGLAGLADAPVRIVGQRYFQRRPIRPLLAALQALGMQVGSATGCPPIEVRPGRPRGGRVTIAGTLSQWISGLLLLAPFAAATTVIEVDGELNERSYIDLTIRMMREFGLHVDAAPDGRRFEVPPNQTPRPATVTLPPDVGAAAFGLAVTALHPSDVLFRGLPALSASETDHPEADLLDIVAGMGLPMRIDPDAGVVRVTHHGIDLAPIDVDCRSVPDMLPILSVLATFAKGRSRLRNIAHVRLKESDRVAAMLQLNRMGGRLEQRGDELVCDGVDRLVGADLSSFNDHRVLMALAVAASRAEGETRLTYPNAYRISYPRFLDEMNGIGVAMSVEAAPARTTRPAPRRTASTVTPGRLAAVPIDQLVARWARQRPDEPAVIDIGVTGDADRTITWREFDEQASDVALALLRSGVEPAEPVAYQLPNCAEFPTLALAVARIGAVSCPLMPFYRRREVAFMLTRSRARVLVVPRYFRNRDYVAETHALLTEEPDVSVRRVIVLGPGPVPDGPAGVQWQTFDDWVAAARTDRTERDRILATRRPAPDARAQLLFTSGTSGEPKGVLHRMNTLTRAVGMEIRHLGLTNADRIFVPSPLAHQTGFLYGMWLAFGLGVPQILQPVWDGRIAAAAIRRRRATFVQAATPFLADLVSAVEESGEPLESLRIFVATGAAVPRNLAERATRLLGAAVCGAWGTTETCLGTLAAPTDEPAKVWGTDGRPLADIAVRVVDDHGEELARGVEGHFEVKTPCLFEGYLDHPEWTAQALTPDGWYRSGDLAVIDESGYVRITGRAKDVINRGGEKIPVAEVEQILHTHPAIRDVAIVAMPDERLGERACAFVVLRPAATLTFPQVQQYLDERHVAKQYWPERLEIIDELPRNPSGKIQKFKLRERIADILRSESNPGSLRHGK
ncbi:3-phosphoshikimate 1-carboxyvinyltransferase [Acidothermus cellulolyticus 11B]|uniref:3-phosphoshikimate 1-carboxyvinyltransferase n=1 Tax=Acidothermus cellulolyticus (strain ATCC 43068 / DSM 8971 / 11B) TaxID=351607 RepID=A0LU54_ACIC1|nr:3-phosphoshikimate 1-carboxyvinyltransferase [Acidothermus cellulolyticus]ABK52964.1 3-phosphoshikimate 1-carboxyvinyltransferase [Acidothermus cellulolyticus 11B]